MFQPQELAFQPGLYGNRSKRASKQRWVDGNLVRFRDGVPAQMGGWWKVPVTGPALTGIARGMLGWRPNNQLGRLSAIGTFNCARLFDGGSLSDITPVDLAGGRLDSVIGAGYGGTLFGTGTYGTIRTGLTVLSASTWTMDMFGEILLACFSGDQKIRRYQQGTDTLLVTIGAAPTAQAVCVSNERHVFAFGAAGNPRLVQWSDRESLTTWTPASTNRAGSYEMQTSSLFQLGLRVRGQVIAWTQTECFVFFPLNNALVYGRETLSERTGVAGPLAACVVTEPGGENAYWISVDAFYVYDGAVRRLNCDLQDYVFKDINLVQRAKFVAAPNIEFGEIRFWYCSAASTEIDRCVVYCFENQTWTKANIARTSWLDRRIFDKPIAVDTSGYIYEHEAGDTADGATMDSFVLSHPLTIGSGQQFIDIDGFWPDLDPLSSGASLTIVGRDYPGAPDQTFGPYTFTVGTEKIDLSISVRQAQMKISGTGGYWELGLPMLSSQPGSER